MEIGALTLSPVDALLTRYLKEITNVLLRKKFSEIYDLQRVNLIRSTQRFKEKFQRNSET